MAWQTKKKTVEGMSWNFYRDYFYMIRKYSNFLSFFSMQFSKLSIKCTFLPEEGKTLLQILLFIMYFIQ